MANLVLTNAFVEIDGTDLSDNVAEVTVNRATEMVDNTAMGDTYRSFLTGLQTWDMEIEFHQDYAASKVHATIWPILACQACFEIRPVNVCTTASNPSWQGTMVIERYPPIGGRVGELLDTRMTARSVGGAITQASSS
jgi:hypothetical protein